MELDEKIFRSIMERSLLLNEMPSDVALTFLDLDSGDMTSVKTCSGDLYVIVNMLRDYARILLMGIEQWKLDAYTRARYEFHADRCRRIAGKLSSGIGYDYDKALKRCQKMTNRAKRDDGIGEEALSLALGCIEIKE